MARFYDTAVDRFFADYRDMTQLLVEEAGVGPSDRVLDLGCGTGMATLPAAARGEFVVGLDLSDAMLARLQHKRAAGSGQPPQLLQADVRTIPLAEGSFDVVLTSFMLPHLADAETARLLAKAGRLLVPGGRFAALSGLDAVTDIYPSAQQWQRWLAGAGFDDIQMQAYDKAYRIVTARRAPEAAG